MSPQPGPPNNISANNIRPAETGKLVWNPDDIPGSLQSVELYAETAADKAISWYWKNKVWKARGARAIQLGAMTSTALAGLIPVLFSLLRIAPTFNTGMAASILVGFAAALIGIDKAFGLSSGWARYVLTATTIRKALEEFRMDWTALMANMSAPPTKDEIAAILNRAKELTGLVEGMVLQETKEWVAEFQNSIAQLEKDTKVQLDALKTQKSGIPPSPPASVEIVVTNAANMDNHTFQVIWSGALGQIAKETVNNGSEWVRISVAPGQYTAVVSATIGGKAASKTVPVSVTAGEHKKLEVEIPIVTSAVAPTS